MAERNILFNFVANTSSLIRGTEQATSAMKKLSKAYDESIGKLTGPVASAITGAGLIIAAKKVGEFEEKVRRMGVQANMSAKGIMEMRQQILSTSLATGNATTEMTALAESALRTSKSSKFVKEELGFLGQVMKASGVGGGILGDAMGEIHEKTGMVGKDFESLIQSLYAFGKTSGREQTFGQILGNIGPLLEQYKGAGLSTKLEDVNAFLTTAMFVPKPATLARALRTMQTKGLKGLVELGFDVSKKTPEMLKVIEKIRKIEDKGLRDSYIAKIFGPQSLLNIQKLVAEYEEYNKNIEQSKKQVQIQKDAADAAKDLSSSMNRIQTAGLIIAQKGLSKPLAELGKWMGKLANDPNLDKYLDRITKLAEGFVLLWGTIKAIQAGKAIFNLASAFGGLFGGVPSKGGKGVGGLGGAAPVYVVNMPGGGFGGLPGVGGGAGAATLAGTIGGASLIALPIIATAVLAWMANKELDKANSPEAYNKRAGETGTYYEKNGVGYRGLKPGQMGPPAPILLTTTNNIQIDGETILSKLNLKKINAPAPTGPQMNIGSNDYSIWNWLTNRK